MTTGKAMEGLKAAVTLTCGMLLEAYNFGTGDGDPENHEQEMSIGYLKHELTKGAPAGYYAWYTDYPEEGAIILTGDSALSKTMPENTSPAPAELSDAEIDGAIARGWCSEENKYKVLDSDLVFAIAKEIKAMLAKPKEP